MKKNRVPYQIILCALFMTSYGTISQTVFGQAGGEWIQAVTDRTMFVTGEDVNFCTLTYNPGGLSAETSSTVYYVELLNAEGTRITGGKYLLKNSSGSGCLKIPEEIPSGIYYLRFYTRVMRNTGCGPYKYIPLKIINPYKTEVHTGNYNPDTAGVNDYIASGRNDTLLTFNIENGRKTFAPREVIRVTARIATDSIIPGAVCISVVPGSTLTRYPSWVKTGDPSGNPGEFHAETRGISLSGHLSNDSTKAPLTDTKINLSIIGDKDIHVIRTGSDGRFAFALPGYSANRDIFISAEEMTGIVPEIFIDNDFCSRPVQIASPVFSLDTLEMNAAYVLAVNHKITTIYSDTALGKANLRPSITKPFYGAPSEVIVMENFIELPTLEDYFNELSVMVKLRKSQGQKQFRFFSPDTEMSFYDPLVLVDWVAVNDIEKVLAMEPSEIERIELINFPYIKGSITYGGIICFISIKNDLAGIDLPSSGKFFNYSFLSECATSNIRFPAKPNIPDSRNTLLWEPFLQMDKQGTGNFQFTTPDSPGKYQIYGHVISNDGHIYTITEEISVLSD
jgi:hypothetical protein